MIVIGVISGIFECIIFHFIYNKFPQLQDKRLARHNDQHSHMWEAAKTLARIPVFTTCLSISMLYLTVLSMGPVMITYMLFVGFSASTISIIRGVSVVFGLLSTFTLSGITRILGLRLAGLVAIWFQMCCLTIAIWSFYVDSTSHLQQTMFFIGICVSRWGLWTFDLIQTQLVQEEIPTQYLGLITGLEISAQNFLEMGAYGLTIWWDQPGDFWIPANISVGAVLFAAMLYTGYYLQHKRGITLEDFEQEPLLEDDE